MADLTLRLVKGSPLTNAEVDGNFTSLNESIMVTGEPMGHANKSDSVLSFNAGTRTVSIAPAVTSFAVWCKGTKHTYTTAQTVVIPDTTGLHYVFFNASGVLSTRMSYFDFENEAPTSYVAWNSVTQQASFFADERHGVTLDWQTHEYLHRTRGAALANGFSISNYTIVGTGTADADAQFDLGGGTFFDEDLQVDIVSSNSPTPGTWQQDLAGPALIPVLYRSGTGWVRDTPTNFVLKAGTATPRYNTEAAGVWGLTDVPNNSYSVVWIIATNNLTYPVVAIMGQAADSNSGQVENIEWSALNLDGFPSVEFRPLYKIVFQCSSGYSNTIKARFTKVFDIRNLVAASPAATIGSAHSGLSGLGNDDHLQYLHVTEVRSPSAAVKASFLPPQASNAGKYLKTDGSVTSWETLTNPNNGTLTMSTSGTGISGSATFTADQAGSSTFTVTLNSSASNVVNTVVLRDGSGNFSGNVITANSFSGPLSGNASTASALATARTISSTGDVVWTTSFDGTGNVSGTANLSTTGVSSSTYGSATQVATFTVDTKGRITAASSVNITPAWSSITGTPTTLAGYGITNGQPLDADLTAIAALTGTSGFLKKTATDTWTLDTNTYVPTNGTGATGTWAISISGNANTATSATSATTATNVAGGVAGAVPYQSGAGTTAFSAAGTSGQYLQSNGTSAPTWVTPPTIGNGTLTMNTSGTGLSGSATFTANQTGPSTFTVASNATSANTASTIVARDASGNFSAGTITASLSGNASTATTATAATTANALNTGNNYTGNAFTASGGYFYANRSAISGQAGIQFQTAGTTNWWNFLDNNTNTLTWYQSATSTSVMTLTQAGALRVPRITAGGSTDTDANLGVQGTSHLTGTIYFGGTVGNVNSWSSLMSSTSGNEVHSVNSFVVNRSGYGGGNILEANTSGYVLGGNKYLADSWLHSDRDFVTGTLITTDINYAVSSGDPWILEIRGNSYGDAVPYDIQYQGYIYSDTIISHGGYSNGTNISGLVALNVGGNLCFWWPRQSYWNGFYVRVYVPYASYPRQRATSITSTAKPSGTKEVALSVNIRQSLHSGNYTSYSPSLTGSGASGTWGISISGSAAQLGGYGSSTYIGKFGNTYYQADNWIQINNSSGLYWPAYNAAELAANTSSSYGAISIVGVRGGWRGIHFNGGGNTPHLMFDGSANGGIYYEGGGRWAYYYNYSNNCWGVGTTNTSATYNLYADKGYYSGGRIDSPIFYDANDTGYFVDPSSTSNIVNLRTTDAISNNINGLRNISPGGGSYVTSASTVSGAIRITLPQTVYPMIRFTVRVYTYDGLSFDIYCGGHTSSGFWYNTFAYMGTQNRSALNVRFTYGGGNMYVYIGELGSSWSYPQVFITDVQVGYSNYEYDRWDNGWAIAFDASSYNTIGSTHTVYPPTSSSNNANAAYASILYDANNTSYYVDPASTSRLNTTETDQSYTYGWFRNYSSNTGLYNQSTTQHLSSTANGYWDMSSTTTVSSIRFYTGGHLGTLRGYVYADTGNNIGFLDPTGNWRLRVVGGDYTLSEGSSMRAPLFYDSNNTAYYWDGASTSTWNESNQNGWHTFNNYGLGVTGTYDSYRLQTVFAMGAAYRMAADGSATSNMYGLAWSHPNAGSLGGANNLNDHGLLLINAGSFRAAISSRAVFTADVRGTLFYDYNNTGYYLDPASTTSIRTAGSWRSDSGSWDGEFAGKIQYHSNNWYFQYTSNAIFRNSGGSNVVTIDSSGNVSANGTVAASSDERLKTNWRGLPADFVEQLAKVKAGVYDRVDEEGMTQVGVSAQSLEPLMPHAVTHNADGMLGVAYGNAALVAAVKLAERVLELERRLAALESGEK